MDEITDYKARDDIDRLIRLAAEALSEWSRPGAAIPQACVPSLRKGLVGVRRIDRA